MNRKTSAGGAIGDEGMGGGVVGFGLLGRGESDRYTRHLEEKPCCCITEYEIARIRNKAIR